MVRRCVTAGLLVALGGLAVATPPAAAQAPVSSCSYSVVIVDGDGGPVDSPEVTPGLTAEGRFTVSPSPAAGVQRVLVDGVVLDEFERSFVSQNYEFSYVFLRDEYGSPEGTLVIEIYDEELEPGDDPPICSLSITWFDDTPEPTTTVPLPSTTTTTTTMPPAPSTSVPSDGVVTATPTYTG